MTQLLPYKFPTPKNQSTKAGENRLVEKNFLNMYTFNIYIEIHINTNQNYFNICVNVELLVETTY